jgi:hypothetical protein
VECHSGEVVIQYWYNKIKSSVSVRLGYFIGVAETQRMIHVVDSMITGRLTGTPLSIGLASVISFHKLVLLQVWPH